MSRLLLRIALVLVGTSQVMAAQPTFDAYLKDVTERAVGEGISRQTVAAAFRELSPDERVIGFDRRQPEFVQTFDEYLEARVTGFRKREGRRLFRLHRELLREIGEKYAVDPEYIVALWGLESSFGRYQGRYSIVRSLATLGHDPRRSAFFTGELIKALRILDEGHVAPAQFVGAWAGAMGQSQFMPGSFLAYAEDYNGDGKKDIWSTEADVFASIANYLKAAAWSKGAGWGGQASFGPLDFESLRVQNPESGCRALRHHTEKMTIRQWRHLGVTTKGALVDQPYALVMPEAGADSGYLVGGNYRAILSYNCANKYAVSVGLLAEAIAR